MGTFFYSVSQEKEDETKMFRDIVGIQVDKSQFAIPPPTPDQQSGKKGKKSTVTQDPPPVDTTSPMIPAPISEIVLRSQNWGKAKTANYSKSNCGVTGSAVNCVISFIYKQKKLNPENEVDGQITMDVIIEAKEGKYRYTVKNIRHKSDNDGMSGGDIYSQIPECGSMKINDLTWKHIKSAAFADAQMVIDDLKEKMKESGNQPKKDDW